MSDDNIIHFKRRETPESPRNKAKPPPMLNIPPATKLLGGILLLVHLTLAGLNYTILPQADDFTTILGGFTSAQWTKPEFFMWWTPLTLLTFSFIHGGWLHLGVNLLMLIAIGSGVERSLGIKKFILIYALSTLGAVLTHLAFNPFSPMPVVGASGGISGLFGAMIVLMKFQEQNFSQNMGVGLRKSVLPVVVVWIAISIGVGMLGAPDGSSIAWIAHIGGFLSGVALMLTLIERRK